MIFGMLKLLLLLSSALAWVHVVVPQKRTRSLSAEKWRRDERDVEYEIDRKVMIRDVPENVDATYLRELLTASFGQVNAVDIDRIAYVIFEEPNDAENACQSVIRIPRDDGYDALECEPFLRRVEPLEITRIFVGNLPYDLDDNKLFEVFQNGGCRPTRIRRPLPGIASIDFGNPMTALRAMHLHGTRIFGRCIRVDWDKAMYRRATGQDCDDDYRLVQN